MIRSEDWSLLVEKWLKFIFFGQKNNVNTYNVWVLLTSTYWVVGKIKQVGIQNLEQCLAHSTHYICVSCHHQHRHHHHHHLPHRLVCFSPRKREALVSAGTDV